MIIQVLNMSKECDRCGGEMEFIGYTTGLCYSGKHMECSGICLNKKPCVCKCHSLTRNDLISNVTNH